MASNKEYFTDFPLSNSSKQPLSQQYSHKTDWIRQILVYFSSIYSPDDKDDVTTPPLPLIKATGELLAAAAALALPNGIDPRRGEGAEPIRGDDRVVFLPVPAPGTGITALLPKLCCLSRGEIGAERSRCSAAPKRCTKLVKSLFLSSCKSSLTL